MKEVSKTVFEPFTLASLRRKTLARLWRLLTMESTLIEVRGQYKKEILGFSILLIGLTMQFIGNFSI